MDYKEILKDAMPIIEKYAPSIAATFSQPLGATLLALGALYDTFGSPQQDNKHDLATLNTNIVNDPSASYKLTRMEAENGSWFRDATSSIKKAEFDIKIER